MTDAPDANESEAAALREQLAARVADNNALALKAGSAERERDDLKARLAESEAQRAGLEAAKAELAGKLDAAQRAGDAARASAARLQSALDARPQDDSLAVLWAVLQKETARLVAFLRSKIPADSPALPWFDKAVATIAKIGCLLMTNGIALIKWATPKAIVLFNQLKAQIEAKLEKK